jgi:hypothetical protein
MKWPEHFPENCPPDDAEDPLAVNVYMLVSTPIAPIDFQTLSERMPDKIFSTLELYCQAHGLSVFINVNHIQQVQHRVRRLRERKIGQCTLTADMGVIKPTHSQFGHSHRTWWIPEGISPWEHFHVWEGKV